MRGSGVAAERVWVMLSTMRGNEVWVNCGAHYGAILIRVPVSRREWLCSGRSRTRQGEGPPRRKK